MKTQMAKAEDVQNKWFLVDADGETVGRLAVKLANILRGKNKPFYTPHVDCGDFVVVINADKVKFSGRKEQDKKYLKYTGYMGGLKEQNTAEVRERNPETIIRQAVWGMMPKGKLGRRQYKKLKVYTGSEHPHEAQTPEKI